MSKNRIPFPIGLLAILLVLAGSGVSQIAGIKITVEKEPTLHALVEGDFPRADRLNPRNLAFVDTLAGTPGLSSRIKDLQLFGRNGERVDFKSFGPGEYVADADVAGWRYSVDLTPIPGSPSHTSWASGDRGILALGDLLPVNEFNNTTAKVKITLPAGWGLFSPVEQTEETRSGTDLQHDRLVIGNGWRLIKAGHSSELRLIIADEWQFEDKDVARSSSEIYSAYVKAFGPLTPEHVQVTLARFPTTVPVDNWDADTRGTSVLILSSDTPFRSQSVQRLHEQLRHEMFHLWFPNGVNLTGSYDWFYEGFSLYESLKTGVALNRIRFEDHLDTLSRAYDIDRAGNSKLSLIDASKQRWSGANNTQVYARGMLVAFLCDIALLESSHGKRSVTDLIRNIFEKHRPPATAADGNEAVLGQMQAYTELREIADRYIAGAESLDWSRLLAGAGLAADTSPTGTRLSVVSRPTGSQKTLLDKLGYNNWRKLTRK